MAVTTVTVAQAGLAAGAAAVIAMTGAARAEDEPASEGPAPALAGPPGAERGPLVLRKDQILIAGSTLNIGLSAGASGEPVSLAPAVWFGLRPKLTVGLTHDGGTTPWTPRPAVLTLPSVDLMGNPDSYVAGGGICVTGDEAGCLDPYGSVGFEALYSLKQGKLAVAGHPGLDIVTFSPFAIRLRLGALGRYVVSKKLSIAADPRLELGVTERTTNKDGIDLPVWAWYALGARLGVYAHTGLAGPFSGFGDFFRVPLQVGASVVVTRKIAAGVDFAFINLIGRAGGLDGRALGIRASYTFDRPRKKPAL